MCNYCFFLSRPHHECGREQADRQLPGLHLVPAGARDDGLRHGAGPHRASGEEHTIRVRILDGPGRPGLRSLW